MEYQTPTNRLLMSILFSSHLFQKREKYQEDLETFRTEISRVDESIQRLREKGNFLQIINLRNKIQKLKEYYAERIASIMKEEHEERVKELHKFRDAQLRSILRKSKDDKLDLQFTKEKRLKKIRSKYKSILEKKKGDYEVEMLVSSQKQKIRNSLQIKAMRAVDEYLQICDVDTSVFTKKIDHKERIEQQKSQDRVERTLKQRLSEWTSKFRKEKKKVNILYRKKVKNVEKTRKLLENRILNESNEKVRKEKQRVNFKIEEAESILGKGLVQQYYQSINKSSSSSSKATTSLSSFSKKKKKKKKNQRKRRKMSRKKYIRSSRK